MKTASLHLRIGSTLSSASLLGEAVRGVVRWLELTDLQGYHVQLCVVEAVTNAIKHAYRLRDDAAVDVDLTVAGDYLQIEVADQGEALEHLPSVEEAQAILEDYTRESGRGLALMRTLMEDLRYESSPLANRLTMRCPLRLG